MTKWKIHFYHFLKYFKKFNYIESKYNSEKLEWMSIFLSCFELNNTKHLINNVNYLDLIYFNRILQYH